VRLGNTYERGQGGGPGNWCGGGGWWVGGWVGLGAGDKIKGQKLGGEQPEVTQLGLCMSGGGGELCVQPRGLAVHVLGAPLVSRHELQPVVMPSNPTVHWWASVMRTTQLMDAHHWNGVCLAPSGTVILHTQEGCGSV